VLSQRAARAILRERCRQKEQDAMARVAAARAPVGVRQFLLLASLAAPLAAFAASDPGVRLGAADAGGALPGLSPQESKFFASGFEEFAEEQSVKGEKLVPNTEPGLGPRFNGNSCQSCHAHPASGGTSPAVNPQVALATLAGATNTVPWFIAASGPVREARFKLKPDGTPDGGVSNLYTITGRSDAPGCYIAQPDFGAPGNPNLTLRIPTPVFGAGLIEAIPDEAILANKYARAAEKAALGIGGRENRNPNDGTITRFGWKAQVKSLLLFAGEAYNVEQGVTNELFSDERDLDPACRFNPLPEDGTTPSATAKTNVLSSIESFAIFMRLLAPPAPAPETPSIAAGRAKFEAIGCALCHTPSLKTGPRSVAALSYQTAALYSDLLVHHMGSGLDDGVAMGLAGADEFRTAPLWGLGQRIFFLHDGRTTDLVQAIQAHASPGSEANLVEATYEALSDGDKQALLDFLRSL
jgi:CxxC motif-containing protein (DUF1111 family)